MLEKPKATGWDTGLCQDYDKGLSRWFSTRIDARHTIRKVFNVNSQTNKVQEPAPQPKRLTDEQMFDAIRPLFQSDEVAQMMLDVSITEYRAIEAAVLGKKP